VMHAGLLVAAAASVHHRDVWNNITQGRRISEDKVAHLVGVLCLVLQAPSRYHGQCQS